MQWGTQSSNPKKTVGGFQHRQNTSSDNSVTLRKPQQNRGKCSVFNK